MNRIVVCLVLLLCAACAGEEADPSPSTTSPPATTTVSTVVTSTTESPPPCPPAPYQLGSLPGSVVSAEADADQVEPDAITSVGGTNTRLWINADGEAAIALVRGTLPPNQFPGERGEVEVAGSRAVAGPYPDGRWVVAWFNEPGARCDQYTMVFYPPVAPSEVEATLADMERVAG